ncbi:hypothetical protein Poly30_05290 [Planctomycetes bacterium Poly30]|uniref:Uncharacterized protein n=1 Tax=Saltatorellus ferox TaxID=2528018 RepID=A0A518ELQ6_9BACT|nr:hypothetical protein Poly30_05290 [Planctomycetes bacterium Poly30]
MDSRINSPGPVGPILPRKLGDRAPQQERNFILPRRSDAEDDEGASSEADSELLSPQPRREAPAVSRVRLEDEAGQRIDLRG